MSAKPVFRLDWCSYAAATYAVAHWHYARVMPRSKLVCLGVWEERQFIGCIVFSRGANLNMAKRWGLVMTHCCELTRIALTHHQTPVSRFVAIATRMLKQQSPGVRLLVRYADPQHGHTGGIYQAMNWVYTGLSEPSGGFEYFLRGRWVHHRTLSDRFGTRSAATVTAHVGPVPQRRLSRKHRYLYPLDAAMRAQILPFAQPYPKRATSIVVDASVSQAEEGGATPTVALRGDAQHCAASAAREKSCGAYGSSC